jgi:flagellar biosynthetic protein FliR
MNPLEYMLQNTPTFLFTLVRTSSILMVAPVFGAINVPGRVKMGLVLILTMLLVPLITPVPMPGNMVALTLSIISEILVGAAIGLVIKFIFTGIEFAGQFASFEMGLSMASVYDPISAAQVTVIGRLMSILTVLLFLSFDGHLMMIIALEKSFELVPPYSFSFSAPFAETLLRFSGDIFMVGAKLAAPIIAVLTLINIGNGLLAKVVPQLNVFVVGFALMIIVGFLMLTLMLPFFVEAIIGLLEGMWNNVYAILRVM